MTEYNPKNPEAIKPPSDEFNQVTLPEPAPEPLNIQPVPDGSIVKEGSLSSPNYRKGQVGWRLSSDGSFEAVDGTFIGTITAEDGTIGGFIIGTDTIVGGNLTLNSAGYFECVQSVGKVKLSSLGLEFIVGTAVNGDILLSSGSDPVGAGIQLRIIAGSSSGGNGASIELNYTAVNTGNLSPGSGKSIDLGTSSNYFQAINYKDLFDRGCLGWFDEGVELNDGRKVSDVEALKSVKRNDKRGTRYGVPMLDYSTMPKAVYHPAPIAEKDIYEDTPEEDPETGEVKVVKKLRFKKGEKVGEDAAELGALVSIMFGAIKELAGRVEILEEEIKSLKK